MTKVLSNPTKPTNPLYKKDLTDTSIIGIQSNNTQEKAFFRKTGNSFMILPARYLTTGEKWYMLETITLKTIQESDTNFLHDMTFYVFESQKELLKWLAE